MTISIHDGLVVGYSVNFLGNELALDIKTVVDEIVTVTFKNYLAHHFDHVMEGSILFDIEEKNLKPFFVDNQEQFELHKLYAWPIWFKDTNELEQYLQKNSYKCYIISSSLGLSGFVFAKTQKIKRK